MSDMHLGDVGLIGEIAALAPAAHWIARQASSVTIVGPSETAVAEDIGARAIMLDPNDPVGARDILRNLEGRFDTAVICFPESAGRLARDAEHTVRTGGRLVRVEMTQIEDPLLRRLQTPDPRGDINRQVVLPSAQGVRDVDLSGALMAALREPDLARIQAGA